MPEGTHDTPVAPESLPNRDVPGYAPETTGRLAHLDSCLQATTLGELALAVQAAKANGRFDADDLDTLRALWPSLPDLRAWFLLLREFPAARVVTPAVAGGEAA